MRSRPRSAPRSSRGSRSCGGRCTRWRSVASSAHRSEPAGPAPAPNRSVPARFRRDARSVDRALPAGHHALPTPHLEERRQEVNDLNVFPVADGDTGDNMAMTMRAVMEELDRLDGLEVDEVGRTQLVQALARAALMGARGNSGVILSQIVRGAAEELASRPGELVDPVLVASAFASAADAAYDSVREPAEGTMLTVFREMAHSIARQLAHLEADKQRLDRDVSDEQQDAVLAEVLEQAIEDGERAVERTPGAARGAARIRRRRRRRLRPGADPRRRRRRAARRRRRAAGDLPPRGAAAEPSPPRGQPLPLLHQLHRLRHGPRAARLPAAARGARRLGARRRRRGDAQGPRPHRRAGGGGRRSSRAPARSPTSTSPTCASRWPSAAPGWRAGRTGVLAVAAGEGLERLFAELGAHVVPGGETLNPSTYELLAGHPRGRRRRRCWSCRAPPT